MLQFLATSTPFFAVIAVGALVSGRGVFGLDAVRVLNTFAFYVATPALVVRVMARQPMAELWYWPFFLVVAGVGVAIMLLTLFTVRRIGGLGHGAAVTRAQSMVGGNFAFLGIPLMFAFLGDRAASPIAMGLLIDTALIVPLAIGLMEAGRGEGAAAEIALRLVRGTIVNPFMLSIIAGLTASFSGVALPKPIDQFLVFLGSSAAPVGIFALGIAARAWSREGLPLGAMAPLVAGKLALHPLIVYVLLGPVLGFDLFWVQAGVLYAALPIAANVFVVAERLGGDSRVAAAAIVVSTALAALTFPAAMWLVTP